jgi:hypothetical protein
MIYFKRLQTIIINKNYPRIKVSASPFKPLQLLPTRVLTLQLFIIVIIYHHIPHCILSTSLAIEAQKLKICNPKDTVGQAGVIFCQNELTGGDA